MSEITIPDKNCYSIPRFVSVRRIRVEIDGRDYEWYGGFGAILKSNERGVKEGDVRCIAGVHFHAAYVRKGFNWWDDPEVNWSIPNDHISTEWIRDFKKALIQ